MEKQEKIREELHENFSSALFDDDILFLHTLYSKLRRLNRKLLNTETECVDLSDLSENICIAADILLRESGKTVVFCGNDTSPVFGNRQILTKAILEAIGNACIFGKGSLVTLKTQEHKHFVSAEIQNLGGFSFGGGEGLRFIRNAVKQFDGEMFTVCTHGYSSVVLTFKKSDNIRPLENRSFIDLVSDRLSPVYIELYGM
ncbi:MAG: hypothetical protein K2G60_05530 [Oscillospiraceae bacterium]|nr:hypothetical protein [Oscillospiraceae bacterium]